MGFWDIFKRSKRGRHRHVSVRAGFAAAKSQRLLAGWTRSAETPDNAIFNDLSALRGRSRESYLNNPFARRFVGMVRGNVVGPKGVVLQARSLGADFKPDVMANRSIEEAWRDWGRAEHCDYRGQLTWVEQQRQALGSAAIDGEILARGVFGRQAGKYAFQLQHLDPVLLDHSYNVRGKNGSYIKMGIEYDKTGRPIAYHLRTSINAAVGYAVGNGRRYVRVPASEIIHAYLPDQVGQTRGYPWMATTLDSLKMLDGYFEAAMTASRAGAAKMGFITSPDGDSYAGDDVDADGAVVSDFEAGVIEQLPDGTNFTAFDPRYPHELFAEFTQSCLQMISGGLGVSYTGLSGNLSGTNYSSGRIGVLEERETWKALQEWFVDWYCRPAFEMWLTHALTVGVIKVAGKPLKDYLYEKYRRVTWQPRRWAWTDPQKDMNANIKGIQANITTVSAVIREQGGDPEEVFQERAWEQEIFQNLGIVAPDGTPMKGA